MDKKTLEQNIDKATSIVGTTWPLYAFVTSNPLSGYEASKFEEACLQAYLKTGNLTYPEASFFKKAIAEKLIGEEQMKIWLLQYELDVSVEEFFKELDYLKTEPQQNSSQKVDQILVKWLSVFLDEGLASWSMPNKQEGFYKAWKSLAPYDQNLNIPKDKHLPDSNLEVIQAFTKNLNEKEVNTMFEHHFAALPGWVGYIKYRINENSPWQEAYPVDFKDYLAVRLLITDQLGLDVQHKEAPSQYRLNFMKVLHHALSEVEKSWQTKAIQKLSLEPPAQQSTGRPEAQLAFCIDTRSELIRRHVETSGNYETFGYAGFFGIAMDYEAAFSGIKRKSCPPIVNSAYKVTEKERDSMHQAKERLQLKHEQNQFKSYFLNRMKNILPSAFGFVEGAGLAYGFQLLRRSFGNAKPKATTTSAIEHVCQTEMHHAETSLEIPAEEQAQIVKSAFDLTGWTNFAPLVVFAGHGSHTANNPFASSLDCGACAASPGRHNARMIAKMANAKDVQQILKEQHDISIPEDTLFIGAEHNTTTDDITLFDADIPSRFKAKVNQLKLNLTKAQETATAERLGQTSSVQKAYKKSTDWSETRPEWGLAKNAGFIIGPRTLTKDYNLEGECFLHSYNWETDPKGEALNAILNGPMVVTQWINNHYYFSTVENTSYGSGSKITHNIVGKFGVVQGNGGDLKVGLPLQSVKKSDLENYHQPQRLSVFIHAPQDRLVQLFKANPHLQHLIENNWIHLLIIDPTNDNKVSRYTKDFEWETLEQNKASKAKVIA